MFILFSNDASRNICYQTIYFDTLYFCHSQLYMIFVIEEYIFFCEFPPRSILLYFLSLPSFDTTKKLACLRTALQTNALT